METTEKKRTILQNKALHVLFGLMAKQLNDAGYDMRKTLKPEIEIPWSKDSIKEYIWKPIMKAQIDKTSTTQMTTKEVSEIAETIMRHFGEKFGLDIPFPSIDELILQQEIEIKSLPRPSDRSPARFTGKGYRD